MFRERSQSQKQRSTSVQEKKSDSSPTKDSGKPRYEVLYENSRGKKERMRRLEIKVYEECGITFNPKKFTSLSQRSF